MKTRLMSLVLGVLLLLTACGGQTDASTDYTAEEIARHILDSQGDLPPITMLTLGGDDFADYLSYNYGIGADSLAGGAVAYPDGASAIEVAVLQLRSEPDSGGAAEQLDDYIDSRIGVFYGYMPDEVAILERAVVEMQGPYVALLICRDPEAARTAFAEAFGTAPTGDGISPTPTSLGAMAPRQQGVIETGYDAEAVLAAYRTGDASKLSYKNAVILAACAEAIGALVTEDMTDYEKELALHDWILEQAEYDQEANNRAADASPHPDNGNPYGLLAAGRAICTGYSSTFQLMMDMVGVECITVTGTAHRGTADHAWNMVRLDGEWYCVDATWNDPVGEGAFTEIYKHAFFNITSEQMRSTRHEWEDETVPEATATTYRWQEVTQPV